jgi:Ulp1 family protease
MSTPRNPSNAKKSLSGRSFNSLDQKEAAYKKIFCKKQIMTKLIPGFLLHAPEKEGINAIDILRLNLQSDNLNNAKVIKPDLTKPLNSARNSRISIGNDPESTESLINEVLNPHLPENEVIVRLGKTFLTRAELLCFREGFDLNFKVVDSYMSVVKSNFKRVLNGNRVDKIVVLNSRFSKILFGSHHVMPQPKVNIFDFSFLVIPYFDIYWILIVVNLKTGATRIYDAHGTENDYQRFLIPLTRFILNSNIRKQSNVNEKFLYPEVVPQVLENISLKDTGIFICKVAEIIAQQKEVKLLDIRSFRREMLLNLLKTAKLIT